MQICCVPPIGVNKDGVLLLVHEIICGMAGCLHNQLNSSQAGQTIVGLCTVQYYVKVVLAFHPMLLHVHEGLCTPIYKQSGWGVSFSLGA